VATVFGRRAEGRMPSGQPARCRRYKPESRSQKPMPYPTDRRYTKEHEWITADGTIGITTHAQDSLGDIVFVELPKVGAEITTGKPFGTVESVKAVSDLYAPVSGTVTGVNEALATAPEQVNKDAHGAWMVKIKVKDPAEMNALLSAADYDKFVSEEAAH
jgi:glycine cleavage system H protein